MPFESPFGSPFEASSFPSAPPTATLAVLLLDEAVLLSAPTVLLSTLITIGMLTVELPSAVLLRLEESFPPVLF